MTGRQAAFAAALVALVFGMSKALKAAGVAGRLTAAEVKALVDDVCGAYFPNVDRKMIRAMIEIESARDPLAFRPEYHINDASIGLMQTLERTAQWLWDDLGYRAYARPTLDSLRAPNVSIYFGAACVNWLRTYAGQARSEEWIVRAYNGGPGFNNASTNNHWSKYQAAKAAL